jgi:hypothetical protein
MKQRVVRLIPNVRTLWWWRFHVRTCKAGLVTWFRWQSIVGKEQALRGPLDGLLHQK